MLYNADLHAFDNPTEETEQYIEAVGRVINLISKLIFEPPLYKLYPNKLYRDIKKFLTVLAMHA